jgi:hypothetical protein
MDTTIIIQQQQQQQQQWPWPRLWSTKTATKEFITI